MIPSTNNTLYKATSQGFADLSSDIRDLVAGLEDTAKVLSAPAAIQVQAMIPRLNQIRQGVTALASEFYATIGHKRLPEHFVGLQSTAYPAHTQSQDATI